MYKPRPDEPSPESFAFRIQGGAVIQRLTIEGFSGGAIELIDGRAT